MLTSALLLSMLLALAAVALNMDDGPDGISST
jgi:hypothetical protein